MFFTTLGGLISFSPPVGATWIAQLVTNKTIAEKKKRRTVFIKVIVQSILQPEKDKANRLHQNHSACHCQHRERLLPFLSHRDEKRELQSQTLIRSYRQY